MNATAVSAILKEGAIIYTRMGSSNVWHQNIVYKCEGNTVYIPLIGEYLQNVIMTGAGIVLKYGNEYFEYLFEGTVSSIKVTYPDFITVNVSKAEEQINTRAFPRYDAYLAMNVEPLWDKTLYFGVTNNLSLMGISFSAKHQFDYSEECNVVLHLPDHQMVFAKGKIIRKTPKGNVFDYGMHFTEMNEESTDLLSDYLSELEAKRANLQNHFFASIKKLL